MPHYSYYTADIFTDQPFGGNPLAVFPDAEGLSEEMMQKIAAEFNLSETVFVFPPQTPQGTKKLRIFTPKTELPFAGHPTVGTAYILAAIKAIPLVKEEFTVIFEEGVGLVPVKILLREGFPVYTELKAAKLPEFSDEIPPISEIASMLSLETTDLLTEEMSPQVVSCGVPFLFVPLRNKIALEQAKLNKTLWERVLKDKLGSSIYLFTEEVESSESHFCARMFAPAMGIEEDPATGSAAAAFGGYLGVRESLKTGKWVWVIKQGVEMGRPSILRVEADKQERKIQEIRVGGASVLMSQGKIILPD